MSKLLVVKGHPLTADYSLSLKGLDAFVKAYKAAHPEDEIEEINKGNVLFLNLGEDGTYKIHIKNNRKDLLSLYDE